MAKRKKKEKKKKDAKKKSWRKSGAVHVAFVQAKERDGHKCQMCGNQIDLTVHHLYAGSKYPLLRADPLNLITLCDSCHCTYHKLFNGYSEHKLINLATFIVYLRMNQYYHNGKEMVENKMVSQLINTLLERDKYLIKFAEQDENKRKYKKEVCV